MQTELELFFPKISSAAIDTENYTLLKKRIYTVLEEIIKEADNTAERAKIDKEILRINKPKICANQEIRTIKEFEKMCAVVSEYASKDPKKMTVFEFYETIELIQQRFKKK